MGVSPRDQVGAADLRRDRVRDRAVTCARTRYAKDVARGGLPTALPLARANARVRGQARDARTGRRAGVWRRDRLQASLLVLWSTGVSCVVPRDGARMACSFVEGSTRRIRIRRWLRGKDGKVRRSLGFASVRSLVWKPLQTGTLSERTRTGANGRWHLPCRRSRVRVPSSALRKPPQKRGFLRGRTFKPTTCTRKRKREVPGQGAVQRRELRRRDARPE
jgi:hypothetical protein